MDPYAEFIAQRYGTRATPIEELGEGGWSEAYSFSLDGREAVVRFGSHVEDYYKDQIMGNRAADHLPIPKVIEIEETSFGWFVVSERRHGNFLDDLNVEELSDALPSMFGVLDAFKDLDVTHSSGYGIWGSDGTGYYESWASALLDVSSERPRIDQWRTALDRSPGGSAEFDLGFDALKSLEGELPDFRHILHSDLLNRNVLVASDRVSAVLDWGNSMYGDYLYDAAWFIYWWPWYPQWASIDIRGEFEAHWAKIADNPENVDLRLLAYQLHIGLDHIAYTASMYRTDDLARHKVKVTELTERVHRL